jgi:hypothetical protein
MKETIDGKNILWTNIPLGEHPNSSTDIPYLKNRYWLKEIYNAHIWIHNGVIKKNHTDFTEDKLQEIIRTHPTKIVADRPKIEPEYIGKRWSTKQMKQHYWLGGILGFILGYMITLYVLEYNNLLNI